MFQGIETQNRPVNVECKQSKKPHWNQTYIIINVQTPNWAKKMVLIRLPSIPYHMLNELLPKESKFKENKRIRKGKETIPL